MTRRPTTPAAEDERRVLGTLFLSPRTFDYAYHDRGLRPEDFENPRYHEVYRAMAARAHAVGDFDRQTVRQALVNAGTLAGATVDATLDELHEPIASAGLLPDYIDNVRERAGLRALRLMAVQVIQQVDDGTTVSGEIARFAEGTALEVAFDDRKDSLRHISEILSEEQERLHMLEQEGGRDVTGVPSGFTELDRIFGGFQKGALYIIGARPAMGKSAFITGVTDYAVVAGDAAVAVFSLEMPAGEIARRLMASRARVDAAELSRGQIGNRWNSIVQANAEMAGKAMWVDDTPSISIAEIRAKVRRHAKTKPLDMVIVDFLQIAQPSNPKDSRVQAVGAMSRELKILARELDIPVIALSQLSRACESRGSSVEDKKPMLSDLRDSGEIEQNADAVMFLFREDYYDPETERRGLVDAIVAKHRNGVLGEIELRFTKKHVRFDNPFPEQAAA